MLTKIQLKKLFNIYDYDIDLTNDDNSAIKFITGPNGYGKTTIIDFIDSVMKQSYEIFFRIPFHQMDLYFSELTVEGEYHYSVVYEEDKSTANDTDIVWTLRKTLYISLSRITGDCETDIEKFGVTRQEDGSIEINGTNDNIQMFYASHSCYYLNDQRLLSIKTDTGEEDLQMDNYNRVIRRMTLYPTELKEILSSPAKSKEYEGRIKCFKDIIDRCDFANKHLEIDVRYGFRFVAEDELRSILTLEKLSSGEKQMIIQVFELLFHAQSETLIMVDEPELSFHMMWQMDYLKNLSEITRLRNFQCIVATHSPQIFNNMWSKSIDLFTLTNQIENA